MKRGQLFFLLLGLIIMIPASAKAQAWTGILAPTYGSGACTVGQTSSPDHCAIDWSTAGIPGGIPSATWTQSGSTILASQAPCNNGAGDCTSTIQAALNSCGASHFVLLGEGTFLIDTGLSVPSDCVLRGAGSSETILNAKGTSSAVVRLGTNTPNPSSWPSIAVSSGAIAGSTSITLASSPSGSSITTGTLLLINELNPSFATSTGSEGSCTWCDDYWNGSRTVGQTDLVTSVSGNTLTLAQPLFINYPGTPLATPVPTANVTEYAGVENLQVYANNTGYSSNYAMSSCEYCWLSGIEGNYADADHVDLDFSYHDEVVNSYFSNAFTHQAGSTDSDLDLRSFTTGALIQNNIFERLHVSIMLEWGVSGNVVAYNYMLPGFDTGSPSVLIGGVDYHGAHPMFNLQEGNVGVQIYHDSVWGSSSDNTSFRNWVQGSGPVAYPIATGRNNINGGSTVICSSIAASETCYPFQASRAFQVSYISTNDNFIGNVTGSSVQESNIGYGTGVVSYSSGVGQTDAVRWPTDRVYDTTVYAWSFGYGEAADTGSGAGDSTTAYSTAFLFGNYGNVTGAVLWLSAAQQILPASFYLSSKPSWWGSGPFPAIGPDVTGGTGPGGHVYAIPAQACYASMGGTDGSGTPLVFNASACYSGSSGETIPAAPSGLNAVVH